MPETGNDLKHYQFRSLFSGVAALLGLGCQFGAVGWSIGPRNFCRRAVFARAPTAPPAMEQSAALESDVVARRKKHRFRRNTAFLSAFSGLFLLIGAL